MIAKPLATAFCECYDKAESVGIAYHSYKRRRKQEVFGMKQNVRIAAQSRKFILYILIALMVFTGTISGESRAQSEILTVTESVQGAVYRTVRSVPLSDEACTEKMIGTQTKLPMIRAFRPLRRAFRALLAEIYVCAAAHMTHQGGLLQQDACQAQICAQGLVTTIQYIHDLDGKKSA